MKPGKRIKPGSCSRLRWVYVILLLLVWGFLVAHLLKEKYLEQPDTLRLVSLETGIRDLPGDAEWMAIFYQGEKLGYVTRTLQNLGLQGYRLRSSTQLKMAVAGFDTEIQLVNAVLVDTLFRLQTFDVRLISSNADTRFRGVRRGDSVYVDQFLGRDSSRFVVYVPENVYSYIGIQPMLSNQGIKPGQHLNLPSFDPLSMKLTDMEIIHEGKETLMIQEEELDLNRIRVSMGGILSYLWLDDNGLTYREESLLGLSMERVSPDQAVAVDSGATSLDLIQSFAIPVDTKIVNPSALKSLTLEVEGLNTLRLIENERQRISRRGETLFLTLRPVPVPVRDPDRLNTYLQSTPLIQSDNPRVTALATRIGADGGRKDSLLVRWVYSHLRKRPVASLNSTVEILDRREGDCSEHTSLFTALSRSLGIPTRIYAGLVYLQGRFLFHAWPVVALDGQWRAVDPTLGQEVADATHIALLETDFTNLYQLLPLLGNITIRVVEQQY